MNSEQISERINLILKKVSLNFKINDLSEPNLEKKSESFIDSMLISLSEILSDKYYLKFVFMENAKLYLSLGEKAPLIVVQSVKLERNLIGHIIQMMQ